MLLKDTPKHKGLRNQLVKSLIEKGIKDKNVLAAIGKVPRHFFMDSGFVDFAYQDKAFPIEAAQTISQPFTVAFQSSLLNIESGHKVLEIGTGSGYQTSILVELGARVYSIERQKILYKKATQMLPKIGYLPRKIIFGDGYKGIPEQMPFDSILVTAGAEEVPKALLQQLKIGGRLVIPVGKDSQIMTLYVREGERQFLKKEFGEFQFVPMLKDKSN